MTNWNGALGLLTGRIERQCGEILDGFPHFGDPQTGKWTTTEDGFWTGGFWVGQLWLCHAHTGDAMFAQVAEKWLARLEPRVDSQTVFRGFLFLYAAALGADVSASVTGRALALRTAHSLASRFDAQAGLIPLGRDAEEAHTVGHTDTNIDGLIASPLLLWSAQVEGNVELKALGLSHALRNAHYCIRPDGGVVQSASFDAATGALTRQFTHKGSRNDSIWTRAQAWAMLGYALSASILPDQAELLHLAEKVSEWWIANLPSDNVAYWDFDVAKNEQTPRDTSGTAIAAAALLKLSRLHPDPEKRRRYTASAQASVEALIERHLTPTSATDRRARGLLVDGCFDMRAGVATSNILVWGDYFLLESLLILAQDEAVLKSKVVSP